MGYLGGVMDPLQGSSSFVAELSRYRVTAVVLPGYAGDWVAAAGALLLQAWVVPLGAMLLRAWVVPVILLQLLQVLLRLASLSRLVLRVLHMGRLPFLRVGVVLPHTPPGRRPQLQDAVCIQTTSWRNRPCRRWTRGGVHGTGRCGCRQGVTSQIIVRGRIGGSRLYSHGCPDPFG